MRIPANFLSTVINEENEQPKNIFDVLAIVETNSPSATSGLHYLSTFNSDKKRNIIIHW
jgi:hypothetical protein